MKPLLFAILLFFLSATVTASNFPFDKETIDLGVLDEGKEQQLALSIKNTSDKPLEILHIEPSCGCTEVSPERAYLKPGENLKLFITIDTQGKIGRIFKTLDIYTSQSKQPYSLKLIAFIKHASVKKTDRSVIFKGACRRCHVGKDISEKYGEELYNALCYICHKKAENISAGSLTTLELIIANGKENTSMPAFSLKTGGVLRHDQIRSLAEFLTHQH